MKQNIRRYVICKKGELLPGGLRSFKAGGRRLAVACLDDGSYKAVANTCPHEMASLANGRVEKMWVSDGVGHIRAAEEKCVIICPWHNFEFDLETGRSPCEPDRLRIATYRAELEEDEVVVYV
ncbi:non-heme iron oxygenase ferredoxin subunit [soil metagenome]|jgi:nitrite reductase/ring-hydroxylating ferredoxin subunit